MGVGGPDSRRSLKGVTTEDRQPGGKRLLSGRGVTEGGHNCPVRPCSPSILHPLLAQKRASETVSLPVADFGVPRLAKHNPLALWMNHLAGSTWSGLAVQGRWVLGRHVTLLGTRSTLACPPPASSACRPPAASLRAC